jgi:hypothetical protein
VTAPAEAWFAALRQAGIPGVPERFSVAPRHQAIPATTLDGIDAFIRIFDRVTTRPAWQRSATAASPAIARAARSEVCVFSAWDFHLPPGRPEGWQLIEFNDNGSGFLFAAIANHVYYEGCDEATRRRLEPPPDPARFRRRIADRMEAELRAFFGERPGGLGAVLDDADSLRQGRFRHELTLLRDLLRESGREAELAAPEDLAWDGRRLRAHGEPVDFVVNRSTDFFWEAAPFAALRAAYRGDRVYVAPNPFTYATRSDKRLLEFLSRPDGDTARGVRPEERAVLSAHVPETRRVREANLEALAAEKRSLVFKPTHGFAGIGVLPGSQVGRSRLRRLLAKGREYVAQAQVPKPRLEPDARGPALWTDLRVWAYRGERLLLSGRGSRRPDALDLGPPGGWLPTFAARRAAETGDGGA